MSSVAMIRRGLQLEYATLAWNVVGSAVLVISARAADSIALGGFALDSAIEVFASLVERLGGKLTAVAVEGKLPAYAATAGEVDEVKQEKDLFFQRVLGHAAEVPATTPRPTVTT